MKKQLKCTRYVIPTELEWLESWRNKDPRHSHQGEQINKLYWSRMGWE